MATIRKRGDTWQCMIRKVGHPPVSASFDTKAEAERWTLKTEATMLDGAVEVQDASTTVRQLFEEYRDKVSVTKRGARWEVIRINRLLETSHFVNKRLVRVSPSDIQAWRDLRLKSVSGETVNREMNQISAIFTYARKEWRMGVHNPVREVKRPSKNPARTRRPSADETSALLKYFNFDANVPPKTTLDYLGWLIECAQHIPMRRGEWCNVLWEDAHLQEQWLHLRLTKNGESRDVPLSKYISALLDKLPRSDKRMFPINPDTVTIYFSEACKELGIDNLHLHDFRHEAITRIAEVTRDALELSAFSGHKDLKALKRYYNPKASDLAKKLN